MEIRFNTMPTVADDISRGYEIGSTWQDQSDLVMYECTDNKQGVAEWKVIGTPSTDILHELLTNKVTSVSSGSTHTQYASALALYNEQLLDAKLSGNNTMSGLNNFATGNIVVPSSSTINAVAASAVMTVVARPASYVKKVLSTGYFGIAGIGTENKVIVIDGTTLTYKAVVVTPSTDILIGTDTDTQIANIVTTITANATISGKVTVVGNTTSDRVLLTSKLYGPAYNYTITSDDANTTPSGATMTGGIAEVRNSIQVGSKRYTFTTTITGDNPTADYENDVRVDTTAGEANMDVVAEALRTAIDTDPLFTVTRSGAVITTTCLVKGAGSLDTGNFTYFVNLLGTAANITSSNFVTGLMTGGINGTPGYAGMIKRYGSNIEVCTSDDFTVTNEGWIFFSSNDNPTFTTGITTPKVTVGTNQVVGAQVAAIGLNAETDTNKITAIIAALRAHGLLGPNA